MDRGLNQAWWALRIGLGLGPFLAGLDKFFNVLANWEGYLSPLATKVLPISAVSFMHLVGIIEMVVGLAILTKFTRVFAYVAAVWLLAIAANLVTTGHYFDVAVRDVLLALSAFTLARLSEARAKVPVAERRSAPAMRPAASHA
ncbi:MAG: DoxX family membrane protein [Myxococcales bacterium]